MLVHLSNATGFAVVLAVMTVGNMYLCPSFYVPVLYADEPKIGLVNLPRNTAPKSVDELGALQKRFQQIVADNLPTVVDVGNGSGVIISPDGYVLTCLHVVDHQPDTFRVTVAGGREVEARKLGYNEGTDACLLKLFGDEVWPHAEMGYSALADPGQWCLPIGYPAHAEATRPPLVRLARFLAASPWWAGVDSLSEGGDCGGPIFDLEGRIIAINRGANFGSHRGSAHIPIEVFRSQLPRLKRSDRYADPIVVNRALAEMMGFTVAESTDEVTVDLVYPGLPASEAGLQTSDVITTLNDQRIEQLRDLFVNVMTSSRRRSKEVRFTVRRLSEDFGITVPLDKPFRIPAMEISREIFDGNVWLSEHPKLERFQRNHPKVRECFVPTLEDVSRATVLIKINGKRNRLGCVVHPSGYVATKAGGLTGEVTCLFSDGAEISADFAAEDSVRRIALLKLNSRPQYVAHLSTVVDPIVGSLLSVAQSSPEPLAIGVVSSAPRIMRESFLAVLNLNSDLTVISVAGDSSIQLAGIRPGDQITSMSGNFVNSKSELREQVIAHPIGDPLHVAFLRLDDTGKEETVSIELNPFGYHGVFLHDAAVGDSHLGGPVVGIDGNVIGINVERFHHISMGAVPIAAVHELLKSIEAN